MSETIGMFLTRTAKASTIEFKIAFRVTLFSGRKRYTGEHYEARETGSMASG